MKKALIIAIVFTLIQSMAYAKSYKLTFTWEKNSEPDLAGYRLYQRDAMSDFAMVKDIIGAETCSLDMEMEEKPYFWVLTAFDDSGNESDYSNEVTYTPDETAPKSPGGLNLNCLPIF